MRAQIGRTPKYRKRSDEDKDAITAGIWHGYSDETKKRLAAREGKKAFFLAGKTYYLMVKRFRALQAGSDVKDFGGWTSQNLDWERGYREGERKEEDRQRGIKVQRSRQAQLDKKQTHQLERYTNPDNPVRIEQRRERRSGLGYRAGERKEQHQEPGTVVASVARGKDHLGPLADPEFHGEPFYEDAGEEPTYVDLDDVVEGKGPLHPEMEKVKDHPGQSCDDAHAGMPHEHFMGHQGQKQFYGRGPIVLPLKIKRYSLWMPFEVKVATKSFGEVKAGDLIVEGFVSAPIKDLQGDVLETPAMVEAKEAMVRAPHNLAWLDHESPYAKPLENQGTPPIAKCIEAKILKISGLPALWAQWLVNRAHPNFKQVAYELKNGFYNAMSMEFVPIRQGQKWIGTKLVNAISSIKYFATCFVRAPANEVATITRVYEKAFANSSRFLPIRVKSTLGFGQTVITKGEIRKLPKRKEAEPENEPEPELEPELEAEPEAEPEPRRKARFKEAEPEPEGEPESDSDDGDGDDDDDDGTPEFPYSRKDYDRETGYVAPERATTAIGEWGDPALEKGRAAIKRINRIEKYLSDSSRALNKGMNTLYGNELYLRSQGQRHTAFLKAIAKAVGVETKGIDEDTPETLGVYEDFATITDEQKPPEVKPGKLKPRPQRFISTFPTDDEDTEEADDQEVGGEPVGVKGLQRYVKGLVRKVVDETVQKKIVVRKGYAEHAGPVPESVRRMQAIQQDDGSLDSQLAVIEAGGQ